MSDQKLAIVEKLQGGPLTCDELAALLPYSRGSIYASLLALEKLGAVMAVEVDGARCWKLSAP